MTNIIATVIISLITNVATTDNAVWGVSAYVWPEGGGPQEVKKPATEQYITTNITERTTVSWTWNGEPKEHVTDKLLSSVTRVLRIKQEWEQGEVRTNSVVWNPDYAPGVISGNQLRIYYGDTNAIILRNTQ